jgi:hypothetical protein
MKPSLKPALGIVLIVLALLMFVITICQITPVMLVDIPCLGSDDSDYPPGTTQDTRIGYCISYYPLKAISGGRIYASGSTNQDEITVDPLVFRREDETLFVNGHPINSREVYKQTDWRLSANPWLIITTRFEIRNDGITPIDSLASANMLFVSGKAVEGWLPNPLGLIILGGGIWLFVRGRKERNLGSNNLAAAG